ncbi:very long chain fatty acid elongase 2-like [Atheta coriaria]|uniref:very long chain fatty acid elongase 2-like n=1 Tax=Dalotia coriaria TaxID=877792 RepID=UPI0031F431A7
MDRLYDIYDTLIYKYADQRIISYPLMGSPFPIIIIMSAYWYMIKNGEKWMANRPAYNIKFFIQTYNILQVLVCGFLGIRALHIILQRDLVCITHFTDSEYDLKVIFYTWLYYLIKISDLLDTVFFVLRKKFTQISTLHVYHHTLMVSVGWIINKYYPAGELVWLGLLNSIVHVFMYFYYFCAVMFDGKINIWWKKYITQAQILQFITLGTIYTIKLFDSTCEYPKGMLVFHLGQVSLLCYMFVNFYYNAYIKQKKTIKKVD